MTNLEKLKAAVITPFPSLCLLDRSEYFYICAEVSDRKFRNKKYAIRASLKDDYDTMTNALIRELSRLNLYPAENIYKGRLIIRLHTIFVENGLVIRDVGGERIVAESLRASLRGNRNLYVAINNHHFPRKIQKIFGFFPSDNKFN